MLRDSYDYLIDDDAELIVLPVAGDGTGSVWLDKFSETWPELKENYLALYNNKKLNTGKFVITYSNAFSGRPVALAITRTANFLTTREISVRNIIESLQKYCRENNIKSVAMTRLGHKEGLSWDHWIKGQYVRVFEFEMNTEFRVHLY